GLANVAAAAHANTRRLAAALSAVKGVQRTFESPVFHEAVLTLDRPVKAVIDGLLQKGIVGGYAIGEEYPELGNALLVCATETRTDADIAQYATALAEVMQNVQVA